MTKRCQAHVRHRFLTPFFFPVYCDQHTALNQLELEP